VKRRITVFIGAVNCIIAAYAQGELDVQPKVFYRNEWSVAVMLNSNGWGANYRYGKRIDAAGKRLFEVDFAYLKDPKERKSETGSGARYVDGKKNLAFDFRLGYGTQREIFRKHDAGGVAIRYFYNFGPSIALLKPIYYDVGKVVLSGGHYILEQLPEPQKYDSNWTAQNIYVMSRASFFKGFNDISIIPGAFAKFGVNFEFSKQDKIVHALEAGLIAEGFIKKLEIIDFTNPYISQTEIAKNQQLFLTLFVSYRFGRIVDPYEIKKKRERSKEISY
jgi:hypothetical protein